MRTGSGKRFSSFAKRCASRTLAWSKSSLTDDPTTRQPRDWPFLSFAPQGLDAPPDRSDLLVSPLTLASWMGRLDEEGPDALVRLPEPVNKFPHFVKYLVKRLKILCPTLGKVKTAQILARAGLHLGPTTVRRMHGMHGGPSLEGFRTLRLVS